MHNETTSNRRIISCLLVLLIPLAGYGRGVDTDQKRETASKKSKQAPPLQNEREQAERETRRLRPSTFPDLPIELIKQLEKRGCTVPQVFDTPEPHNVIRGQFARKGQTDWAVLCLKNGKSSILIFWGKPARCPSELAVSEDRVFLQSIGNGRIGYSRRIDVASKNDILENYKQYRGSLPPILDHQGIDDRFVGKASDVHYCYQGKWLKLSGAD